MKRATIFLVLIVLLVLFISSCYFKPEKDFSVSSFLDMRANNIILEKFSFSSPGEYIGLDKAYGSVFQGSYSVDGSYSVTFTAVNADSNGYAYKYWKKMASDDKKGIEIYLLSIPNYYGSYTEDGEDSCITAWFYEKWVFRIEAPNKELLEFFYSKIENFTKQKVVINRSVKGI